jgi:hypothetical protein
MPEGEKIFLKKIGKEVPASRIENLKLALNVLKAKS